MGRVLPQGRSANVHIGPLLNVSASIMVGLAIDNDAIVLIPEAGTSSQRSNTTSAASIGPGMYRVVLNASDTATMGGLDVLVSGSGAILWREHVEIWQAATWDLYYGSADQVLGSAAASALVTAVVQNVLDSNQIPSSAAVSGIVIQALTNYDVPTSAGISAIVTVVAAQVLADYDVPTSADVSAIVSGVAAQALSDYAALVSANLSAGVDAALVQRGLHMLVGVSASVAGINDNSIIGRIWASTSANAYDRTTDSLRAIAAATPSSAAISGIAAQALSDYDVPTSADISAVVSVVAAQALADRSAAISGIIEQAVFQRALTEPTGAPTWAGMNFDVAIEWVVQRAKGQHHQASTSVGTFNSAGTQIASASVNITSTSANQDVWVS